MLGHSPLSSQPVSTIETPNPFINLIKHTIPRLGNRLITTISGLFLKKLK
jgi:hypothetical protein